MYKIVSLVLMSTYFLIQCQSTSATEICYPNTPETYTCQGHYYCCESRKCCTDYSVIIAPWLCLIISSVFLILFTVMACWKCHGIGIFKEKSKKATNLEAANMEMHHYASTNGRKTQQQKNNYIRRNEKEKTTSSKRTTSAAKYVSSHYNSEDDIKYEYNSRTDQVGYQTNRSEVKNKYKTGSKC